MFFLGDENNMKLSKYITSDALGLVDNKTLLDPESKLSIYRKYQYTPDFKGIKEDMIALHPASIRELVKEDNSEIVGKTVVVSRGNRFCYFWRHPYHATRISMKLGVPSIVLALISIIVTVITSCHCC